MFMLPKREVIVIHSDSEDDFQEYPRFKRPREQEVKERRQTPKKRRNSVPPASLSKKAVGKNASPEPPLTLQTLLCKNTYLKIAQWD